MEDKSNLCALAFKVLIDQQRGPLVFLRVYSGVLQSRATVINSRTGKKEKILKLCQMHANIPQEIQSIASGNIGVAIGLKDTSTGDTIYLENTPAKKSIKLDQMVIPNPVFYCSVEPDSASFQQPLDAALENMKKEDPSLIVELDPETGQTIIKGMGELHLDIVRDRLVNDFKVPCAIGKVQIAYRETLTDSNTKSVVYDKKISTTKHYFAKVTLQVEPAARNQGNTFHCNLQRRISEPTPEAVREYSESVKRGAFNALMRGTLLGYPFEDVLVTLVGGSFISGKAEELNEQAFEMAAQQAVTEALRDLGKAKKVHLLEPFMDLEIITDSKYMGPVLTDLTGARRAKIKEIENVHGEQVIRAEVPLSEMIGYSSHLRSMTHGNSHYHMEFARYEALTNNEQEKILKGLNY